MLVYLLVLPGTTSQRAIPVPWPRRAASAAAVLESRGHDVRLFDLRTPRVDRAALLELLESEDPCWILLDTLDGLEPSTTHWVEPIRSLCSARIALAGECAPHGRLALLSRRLGAAEWCEGAYDLHIALSTECPTLFQREPSEFAKLPSPAWHHLNGASYSDTSSRNPEFWIEGSLPVRAGQDSPRCIVRPAESVARDVDSLLSSRPSIRDGRIHLFDHLAARELGRALELHEALKRKHVRLVLWSPAEDLQSEALEKLRSAGVRQLKLEICLGGQATEDAESILQVRRAVATAREHKLPVHLLVHVRADAPAQTSSANNRAIRRGFRSRHLRVDIVPASNRNLEPIVPARTDAPLPPGPLPWSPSKGVQPGAPRQGTARTRSISGIHSALELNLVSTLGHGSQPSRSPETASAGAARASCDRQP